MAEETDGPRGPLLLSFLGGPEGYCALLADGERAEALCSSDGGWAEGSGAAELGRAELATDGGALELRWSPAGPMLEFGMGEESVRAYPITGTAEGVEDPPGGVGVAWELPAGGFAAVRTLWAAGETGDLTMLVAVRAVGAASHEEEVVGAARLIPGAEPYGYVEPLLSTEYDGAGSHTRATLELWAGAEEPHPERGAGQRVRGAVIDSPLGRLEAARFTWRLDGRAAIGAYEILTP